jgi:uncharacterized membrane protein YdjX (TVP38/TMEM64 family)
MKRERRMLQALSILSTILLGTASRATSFSPKRSAFSPPLATAFKVHPVLTGEGVPARGSCAPISDTAARLDRGSSPFSCSPTVLRHCMLRLRGGGSSVGVAALFSNLITTVESMGPAAPVGFAAAYIGCEMVGIPPGALVVFAGAFFGTLVGTALALANGIASAAACFFVGRRFRESFLKWLQARHAAYKQFAFIDRVISRGGFRALLLLRLVPTPIPGMNYFYGVTAVHFPSYITATAMGYLPGTAALAYSGAAGKSLFEGGFTAGSLLRRPSYVAVTVVVVAAIAKAATDVGKTIAAELNELGDDRS